jgi:hypothetical protein
MKVYAVRGSYKKFAGLLYKDRRVASSFYDREPAVSLASQWENFEVIKDVGDDGLTTSRHSVGNFANLEGYDNPTFDDVAKAVLAPYIARYGEFLPVRYANQNRWMFNCLHMLSALDVDNSVITRFTDGRIMHLQGPLYFNAPQLIDEWIFLPAERPYQIFVTDKFVKVVEDNKLTGFDFNEIWDSNDLPAKQKPYDPALLTRRDLN